MDTQQSILIFGRDLGKLYKNLTPLELKKYNRWHRRKHYKKDPEKVKKEAMTWYYNNRERAIKASQIYYTTHKKEILQRHKRRNRKRKEII